MATLITEQYLDQLLVEINKELKVSGLNINNELGFILRNLRDKLAESGDEVTLATITGAISSGHAIGTFDNGETQITLKETNTTLTYSGITNKITYTGESGVTQEVDLTSLAVDINIASVAFNPATGNLTITETDNTEHIIAIGVNVIVSADANNLVSTGTDGGSFINENVIPTTFTSTDASNDIYAGTDGKSMYKEWKFGKQESGGITASDGDPIVIGSFNGTNFAAANIDLDSVQIVVNRTPMMMVFDDYKVVGADLCWGSGSAIAGANVSIRWRYKI